MFIKKCLNLRLISILLFAVVITACGGGSDGDTPASTEPAVWDNTNWDNINWQ